MFKKSLLQSIIAIFIGITLIYPLSFRFSSAQAHASRITTKYIIPSHNKVDGVNNILPINPNDNKYDNYLNGAYSLWNKPSYYEDAKRVITWNKTYQLAKNQVSFRILKRDPNNNDYYLFQSMHRYHYYIGWINANNGAYRDLFPGDTKLKINVYHSHKKNRNSKSHRNIHKYNNKNTLAPLNDATSKYITLLGYGKSKNYKRGIKDAFFNTFSNRLKNNEQYKDGFIEFVYLRHNKLIDNYR